MKDDEGPQDRYAHEKTCSGCKHFESVGKVFGHNFREDNTYCNHDQVVVEEGNLIIGVLWFEDSPGRRIETYTRDHRNPVPHWCPFLRPVKLSLDERLEQLMQAAEIRLGFRIDRLIRRFQDEQRSKEFFRTFGETGVMIQQPKTVWPRMKA